MVHSNLPPRAWGWAILLACEVVNRTTDKVESNKKVGAAVNASRLEKWHGKYLPNQTNGLYPFGYLCFKHVPAEIRTKMEPHATPMVYLGIDSLTRAFTLGSLFELHTSSSVDVTFFENAFPFRKLKNSSSPTSLLWSAESTMQAGDIKLGNFGSVAEEAFKVLDKRHLRTIGAIPDVSSIPDEVITQPETQTENFTDQKENAEEPTQPRRSARVTAPVQPIVQRYRIPGAPPYYLRPPLICPSTLCPQTSPEPTHLDL